MGLTFKENCPDLRNTRVVDIITELHHYNITVDVCDPWVDHIEAMHEYGLSILEHPEANAYDAIILTVAHRQFKEMNEAQFRSFGKSLHVIYDLKYILPQHASDMRL